MANPVQVHVIGASGRSGAALCQSLLADDVSPVPIVRSRDRWEASGIHATARLADSGDAAALGAALADATHVVSCAHARHAGAVIAAVPAQAVLILLGSTRKFTRWPDEHGNDVIAGERVFLSSGRNGVMLHPTMIYGAQGEDNVQRLAALLRWLPVIPLPDGGRALVQPIHQDDVTRAIRAALIQTWDGPRSLVIAGPVPLPYVKFTRAVAAAAGLHDRPVIAVPAGLLTGAAGLLRRVPGLPRVHPDEIRRLLEDKAFDVEPMRQILGIEPIPLQEGLARTFASKQRV